MIDQQIALPGQPRDDSGPVFREPWEAQAFAMTLALHERGLFSWNEWARALAAEIAAAQAAGDADLGDTYYRHWLAALERLITAKGVSSAAELARLSVAAGCAPQSARRTAFPSSSAPRISARSSARRGLIHAGICWIIHSLRQAHDRGGTPWHRRRNPCHAR